MNDFSNGDWRATVKLRDPAIAGDRSVSRGGQRWRPMPRQRAWPRFCRRFGNTLMAAAAGAGIGVAAGGLGGALFMLAASLLGWLGPLGWGACIRATAGIGYFAVAGMLAGFMTGASVGSLDSTTPTFPWRGEQSESGSGVLR